MGPTDTKTTKRRARTRANHRGVVIIKPRPEAGKLCYALRWRDLDDPTRVRTRVLDGITERRAAEPYALRKAHELDAQRRDIEVNGRCAVRLVSDEIKHYLTEAAVSARKGPHKGERLSATTVEQYTRNLALFQRWCDRSGKSTLKQLGRAELAAYKSSRAAPESSRGGHRKASTINLEIKPVRQMLLLARAQGRYESLDSDAIRAALERYAEPKPAPVCHPVAELRGILRCIVARDAQRRAGGLAAPAFALALLGGLRLGEITAAVVGNYTRHRPTAYDPTLTHPVLTVVHVDGLTKTGARMVALLPYSPLLVELLDALTLGRAPSARLVDFEYEAIGDEAAALGIEFKSLRSTCCSYQGPLPGDNKTKADRLGHSEEVATRSYKALPFGSPASAASLDEIMQCEPELRAIIDAVSAARTTASSRARRRAG